MITITSPASSPLISVIDEQLKSVKAGKALVEASQRLTYGELRKRIYRLSTLFGQLGLSCGDRVLLASQEDLAVVTLFLALVRNGLTAVIADPESTPDELEKMAQAADVRGVFVDRKLLDDPRSSGLSAVGFAIAIVEESGADGGAVLGRFLGRSKKNDRSDEVYPGLLDSLNEADRLPEGVPEKTTAYILFTSGTTSQPKGVEITHRNLHAQMSTFLRQYGYDTDARLLNILPLYHTDGLTQGPVIAFYAGATVYRPLRFRLDLLQDLLDRVYSDGITHLITVPAVLTLILNLAKDDDCFDTPEFRYVISTAAYLDEKLWRDFEAKFKIMVVNVYGLTETVCESFYCGPDDATRKVGTIGKPVDCEARIVDETGKDVRQGEIGELLLRGAHIMKGYFNMPEATAEVLDGEWFRTGDLAAMDSDGFYSIVGRKKNVIIRGGINIYPEDITTVLRSLPDVLDAVTLGIEDETWGEQVVSCVVPMTGRAVSIESVTEQFLCHASREKLPNEIHLVQDLPRGPAGKVVLDEVRAMLSTGSAIPEVVNDTGDVETRLFQTASRIFKTPPEQMSLNSDPENTRGWNSLAHVEFLLQLEKDFQIRMSPQAIMTIKSLGDALEIVQRELTH